MPQVGQRRMRADALANRERLLQAAETHFAEYGIDVPFGAISESAGVGTGTLYRNFASHEELIAALYERIDERFREIMESAEKEPSGWSAIETYLRESALYLLDHPAAAAIIARHVKNVPEAGLDESSYAALTAIVARAQAEGSARSDLSGRDLAAAPLVFGSMHPFDRADRDHVAARMVHLILDGMRAHPYEPSELPSETGVVSTLPQ